MRTLPFADGYADRIAAIHVFEHFYRWEAETIVREWARVLKPGGELILELPCLNKVFAYIVKRLSQGKGLNQQIVWWALWGDPRYQQECMVHRWGYSQEELTALLEQAGLTVREETPRYHRQDRDMRLIGVKGVV